jgi:hypothetical protein
MGLGGDAASVTAGGVAGSACGGATLGAAWVGAAAGDVIGGTLSRGLVAGAVNGVMTTPLPVAAFSGDSVSRGLGLAGLSVAAGLAAGAGAATGGGSGVVLQGMAHALRVATRVTTISSLSLASIILYTSPWY